MSSSVKNYTEQGGEKTVIGGTLEFTEGAQVKGLPSSSSALVLDCGGITVSQATENPLDITEAVPLENFTAACSGENAVIIRGVSMQDGGAECSIQTLCCTEGIITGMGVLISNAAVMMGYIGVYMYSESDRVYIRLRQVLLD